MTLPSMRFTLPSILKWQGSTTGTGTIAGDNELGLTWYRTSSSVNVSSDPPDPRSKPERTSRVSGHPNSNNFNFNFNFNFNNANNDNLANTSTATPADDNNNPTPQQQEQQYPPYTFTRSLKLGPYRGKMLHHFCKPWSTLRLPATWIIMLQYGGLVGGVAVISTVGPQILSRAPYHWGEHAGLLFVGALVGIVLGGLCTGLAADRQATELARGQDHGYAEPEARVALMVPSLLVGTGGLLVFGFCAQYPGPYRWVGLEFAFGMVAFALAQVPSIWFGYVSACLLACSPMSLAHTYML